MKTAYELVKAHYEANDRHDIAGMIADIADDCRWTEMEGFPCAGTYIGGPAVVENVFKALGSTFDDYTFTLERLLDADGSAMIELVRGLIDGKPDPLPQMPRPPLDLLLERVKAFIAHNLSRPDLSVELIARRMGCSQRYVYRAFDQHGTTPSDYVWGLRLEHARACLERQDQRARSITDVAFSLGFSSTSHFSRAFRQRHGMTPSDCRRQA